MIWPATWFGAVAGFVIASIPGALLGGLLGQVLDRQLRLPSWSGWLSRSSSLGVDELRFILLGRLARLNGRVLPTHIEQARDEMRRLGLDAQAERLAMAAFSRGKSVVDDLQVPLGCLQGQRADTQSLLLSCWRMACATGAATAQERELIMLWGHWLGWPDAEVAALTIGLSAGREGRFRVGESAYRDALDLLGVSAGSDLATIKKAYRRQLSLHHPDKHAGAGASPEQVRVATEKTRNLHAAYGLICEQRGIR